MWSHINKAAFVTIPQDKIYEIENPHPLYFSRYGFAFYFIFTYPTSPVGKLALKIQCHIVKNILLQTTFSVIFPRGKFQGEEGTLFWTPCIQNIQGIYVIDPNLQIFQVFVY